MLLLSYESYHLSGHVNISKSKTNCNSFEALSNMKMLVHLVFLLLVSQSTCKIKDKQPPPQTCSGVFGETCRNGVPHSFVDDYHFPMVADEERNMVRSDECQMTND